MKSLYLLLAILCSAPTFSQIGGGIEKRHKERNSGNQWSANRQDAIYSHSNSHYRPIGWHVNAGVTYMIGNNPNDKDQLYDLTPTGLPGYYLEGGMEHLFRKIRKAAHYVDWGIGIKHFGGQEKFNLDPIVDRGSFNFGSVFVRGGIHNVWQLSKWNFIDQSIGINLDYRIYGGKDHQATGKYLSPLPSDNQSKLVGQLHYTFGFGFKVKDGLFFVPTIQTPILTVLEFNDFNPSHKWFNSRYQPLIVSLKMAWLWPKSGCPKVFSVDGQRQSDQFQME
ncbi:hypothetical protein [Crocinitomix algicola]|uniref:hypothetical protein n=1 Tax=Crocinitomix algicola TaxID=1740263 RepID=UPI001112D424|nr:hypothetical protein [Crocinitomix algicola]